jgi:formyltetrahydrofolate hydrolase
MDIGNNQASHPCSAILLIHCPDAKGLVLAVTEFLYQNNGNILHLDQHVESEEQVIRGLWPKQFSNYTTTRTTVSKWESVASGTSQSISPRSFWAARLEVMLRGLCMGPGKENPLSGTGEQIISG